ncbi:hypothetical protein LAUMK41_05857 [Mycobacterium attenuatum]|nr:hypothetical protein LAUMK41_05857 [Mycobacterium attenuatum]
MLVGFVLVLIAAISPYLLGTYIAVQLGAANPSTARSTTGWVLELVTVIALIAGIWAFSARSLAQAREHKRQLIALAEAQAREEAREHAKLVASGVVYPARHVNSTVYRHGACTINHRSTGAAEKCRLRSGSHR